MDLQPRQTPLDLKGAEDRGKKATRAEDRGKKTTLVPGPARLAQTVVAPASLHESFHPLPRR